MSDDAYFNELKAALLSSQLEVQVEALTAAYRNIDELLCVAVKGLSVSSNPAIYADWLARTGPLIVHYLQKGINCLEGEPRFFAAALLLSFGDRSYVGEVLAELETHGPNELIAAAKLAQAAVPEAGTAILSRLSRLGDEYFNDAKYAPFLQTLLNGLALLEIRLPAELTYRIQTGANSRYLRFSEP